MATYLELCALGGNTDLRNKVEVACIVAADAIRSEDAGTANHANRLKWAKGALEAPRRTAESMLMAVLAQNKAATGAQITGATDATIQTAVNSAVDLFATGA